MAASAAAEVRTVEVDRDGQLRADRDIPVGGQAVIEGVMMRGVNHWSVAVRRPDGTIGTERHELESAMARHRVLRLPVVRGFVALCGSMAIGFRALEIATNAQLDGDEAEEEPKELSRWAWIATIAVALGLAVVLFFIVPVSITSLFKNQLGSAVLFWLVEGIIRTLLFLGYLWAISKAKDMRRVFEYHGAEHKTISCLEAGMELTPANAQRFSRLHPRCGTSFLLIVMIVAIFAFAPIGLPSWYLLVLTRIVGVPIIAGVSFEIIKYAGRHRTTPWVRALIWPGLKLQLLTTREPDLAQLEVAIAALNDVLAVEDLLHVDTEELVGVEVVA